MWIPLLTTCFREDSIWMAFRSCKDKSGRSGQYLLQAGGGTSHMWFPPPGLAQAVLWQAFYIYTAGLSPPNIPGWSGLCVLLPLYF